MDQTRNGNRESSAAPIPDGALRKKKGYLNIFI